MPGSNIRTGCLLLVAAFFCLSIAGCSSQEAATIDPQFGMYLAADSDNAGASSVSFRGRTYHLQPEPVVSANGVASVHVGVMQSNNGFMIEFVLSARAAHKLHAVTSHHVGDTLCMTVGTRVVTCPVIRGVMGKRFMISFPTLQQAKQAYRLIANPASDQQRK